MNDIVLHRCPKCEATIESDKAVEYCDRCRTGSEVYQMHLIGQVYPTTMSNEQLGYPLCFGANRKKDTKCLDLSTVRRGDILRHKVSGAGYVVISGGFGGGCGPIIAVRSVHVSNSSEWERPEG